MDYRKEHNGWPTFQEHWWFLGMAFFVLVPIFVLIFNLPNHLHSHGSLASEPGNNAGFMSSGTGSVYWCVLSKPGTNELQFVLSFPATATFGQNGGYAWPSHAYDYCDFQVNSNGHQWKIENDMDWKTGVHTVLLRDLTANTTEALNLDIGRFWQLDDPGQAKRLESIDRAMLDKILGTVKTNVAKRAMELE
jgi:hypothetical protein